MQPSPLSPRVSVIVWLAGTVAVTGLAVGATHALADTGRDSVRFDRTSGTHATAVDRIIVRGKGCLTAEDMTHLRLVDYAPARNVVIYRCIQP